MAKAASTGKQRHQWVKLEIHEYVCAKCGIRKTNVERGPSDFVQSYHFPNGTKRVEHLTPPCEPGPLTEERLAEYSEQIDAKLGPKRFGWRPPF